MSDFDIKIECDNLDVLQEEVKKRVKAAVAATAFNIEAVAKVYCPVDTGRLRNSISTRFTESGLGAEISPHTDYAVFVEFGTRFMRPQPYMYPAAVTNYPPFISALNWALKKAGRKADCKTTLPGGK